MLTDSDARLVLAGSWDACSMDLHEEPQKPAIRAAARAVNRTDGSEAAVGRCRANRSRVGGGRKQP